MKLHITPRQNVYNALYKLNKNQQNDLRNGIKESIDRAMDKGAIQWNNDVTMDLDMMLIGNRHITTMINVMLNAEDGDIHCRIDHLIVHKNKESAEHFNLIREKQNGFKRVL